MFLHAPDDPDAPVLQTVVVARRNDILEAFTLNERFHDHPLVLLCDLPCPDQAVQEGGGLLHDPIDSELFAVAGGFILISLLLAHFVSPYWLWFTAFVGANLLQYGITGFCPMVNILKKLGVRPSCA